MPASYRPRTKKRRPTGRRFSKVLGKDKSEPLAGLSVSPRGSGGGLAGHVALRAAQAQLDALARALVGGAGRVSA